MSKLVKSLLVVAGVAITGVASAQAQVSTAEKAGLCAGNASVILKAAEAAGPQYAKVADLARSMTARNYKAYGQQPGFLQAAKYSINQPTPMDQRIKMADGCEVSGF